MPGDVFVLTIESKPYMSSSKLCVMRTDSGIVRAAEHLLGGIVELVLGVDRVLIDPRSGLRAAAELAADQRKRHAHHGEQDQNTEHDQ